MDALTRLLYFLSYYEQNSTNYRILVTLMRNLYDVPGMNIQDVAALCYVSTATVSRLVQDMEFDNYAAFRVGLEQCLKDADIDRRLSRVMPELTPENVRSEMESHIEEMKKGPLMQLDTCQELIEIARQMKKATNICFLITSTQLLNKLQRILFLDGKCVTVHKRFEDGLPFATELKAGDMVLATANSMGELQLKINLLRELHNRGVNVTVFSNMEDYDWHQICDYRLPHDLEAYGVWSNAMSRIYEALPQA